jgi:hypothetical protein
MSCNIKNENPLPEPFNNYILSCSRAMVRGLVLENSK